MKRTQAERSSATRDALLRSARVLFAEHGYAGVAAEVIVRDAGVTRGALYHQFEHGKAGLFEAVVEAVEQEVVGHVADAVVAAGGEGGPLRAMEVGMVAWLEACARPGIQRIMLVDGPAVLGWTRWRELGMELGLGLVVGMLEAAMEAGQLPRQPSRPLGHVLVGALDEAALYVAGAPDPVAARAEMTDALRRILAGLSAAPGPA